MSLKGALGDVLLRNHPLKPTISCVVPMTPIHLSVLESNLFQIWIQMFLRQSLTLEPLCTPSSAAQTWQFPPPLHMCWDFRREPPYLLEIQLGKPAQTAKRHLSPNVSLFCPQMHTQAFGASPKEKPKSSFILSEDFPLRLRSSLSPAPCPSVSPPGSEGKQV